MIVSIMQPAYLPWLGYFERIARSDIHVVLDHVQFEKNSFTNRNRIKTRSGPAWLTIPVQTAGRFGDLPITGVQIDNSSNWRRKHWETVRQAYAAAQDFRTHEPFLREFYARDHSLLGEACDAMTRYLLATLRIHTPLVHSATLKCDSAKSTLVLDICRHFGATTYLSGPLGRGYLDLEAFRVADIHVEFQDYEHPTYRQLHGGFLSHLSVIDLLCNEGPNSLALLLGAKTRGEAPPALPGPL